MTFERTVVTLGVRFSGAGEDLPVLTPERRPLVHRRLRDLLPEAEIVLVATCQRTEVLLAGVPLDEAMAAWHAALSTPPGAEPSCLGPTSDTYVHVGEDALRHVCRVACGLDSAILGDADVASQLRMAHREAEAMGTLGPTSRRVLRAAFATAKTARATTTIASGARGASAAAAAVIGERRPGARVVIVGTGMAARGVLRHLHRAEHGVTVVGRDAHAAGELAGELGAIGGSLDALRHLVVGAGAIVAAIPGPSPAIQEALVERSRDPSLPLVVDMGVPRCVEPLPSFELVTLDDLAARRASDDTARQAVPEVEALIERTCRAAAASLEDRAPAAT